MNDTKKYFLIAGFLLTGVFLVSSLFLFGSSDLREKNKKSFLERQNIKVKLLEGKNRARSFFKEKTNNSSNNSDDSSNNSGNHFSSSDSFVSHHFGMYASGSNAGSDISESFEILNDLGVKEISYFSKDGLSSAQLNNSFEKFDKVYQKALENGINIMPWVRARNHSDCTKLDISQMTDYLSEMIDRYPKIKYWKILKEPDQVCRKNNLGSNFRLGADAAINVDTSPSIIEFAKEARKTLDSKCSDCKLVFGGFGPSADEDFYNSLLENNFYENFDVLGLLGYKWFHLNFRPDKSKEEFIIQSSINPADFSETDVAKGTVELFTYFFSLGFDRIYYEEIFDFGDKNNSWGSRGLITQDNRKKEVYYSFKTLVNQLEGFNKVEAISECDTPTEKVITAPPSGKCYYKFDFEEKDPVYVLWCTEGNCDIPSELPDKFITIDYLGNEQLINKSNLVISKDPLFIRTGENLIESTEKVVIPKDSSNEELLQRKRPTKSINSKLCGDGICNKIESERGICPEDCR